MSKRNYKYGKMTYICTRHNDKPIPEFVLEFNDKYKLPAGWEWQVYPTNNRTRTDTPFVCLTAPDGREFFRTWLDRRFWSCMDVYGDHVHYDKLLTADEIHEKLVRVILPVYKH